MKLKMIFAAMIAAMIAAMMSDSVSAAMPQAVAAKLPTIQGTYTPPTGVDWGCGKGKKVTVKGDGSRICPTSPYKGGK